MLAPTSNINCFALAKRFFLPAEPAFPCGDDNSNSNSNSNSTSRFGLGIFPAGGGPAGSALDWGFSRPAAVQAGTALDWGFSGISRDFSRFAVTDIRAVSAGSSGSSSAAHLYRTFFSRIPVVPHIFLSDCSCPAHFSLEFQLYRTFFSRLPDSSCTPSITS